MTLTLEEWNQILPFITQHYILFSYYVQMYQSKHEISRKQVLRSFHY